MSEFTINEMIKMQRALQDKYKDKWEPICPEVGQNKLHYMSEFTINEMIEMQRALQDKYKDKWEPICPEVGQNKLLWLVGEIGEVIDIAVAILGITLILIGFFKDKFKN